MAPNLGNLRSKKLRPVKVLFARHTPRRKKQGISKKKKEEGKSWTRAWRKTYCFLFLGGDGGVKEGEVEPQMSDQFG